MITYKLMEPTKENSYLTEQLRLKSYGINPSPKDFDEYYIENICNGTIIAIICYQDNKPIGGCYISDTFNSIYIDYLFVLPEYQNKGLHIGRSILQYIFDNKNIVEEYYNKEFTQSKLYATSPKSKALYKKIGYKEQQELLCKELGN